MTSKKKKHQKVHHTLALKNRREKTPSKDEVMVGRLRARPNKKCRLTANSVAVLTRTTFGLKTSFLTSGKLNSFRAQQTSTTQECLKDSLSLQQRFPKKAFTQGGLPPCWARASAGPCPERWSATRTPASSAPPAHLTPTRFEHTAGRAHSLPASSSGATQHLPSNRTSCRPEATWREIENHLPAITLKLSAEKAAHWPAHYAASTD